MYIVGVVIGPAIGFGLGYMLYNAGSLGRWARIAIVAILLLAIALVPIAGVELRLGLATGIALGLLIWFTPVRDDLGESTDADGMAREVNRARAEGRV